MRSLHAWLYLSIIMCLTACVSLSNDIRLSIYSYNKDSSSIQIDVAPIGFHSNIHGGKYQGHYITVPRHQSLIPARQIKIVSDTLRLPLADNSSISIMGGGPCDIHFALFTTDGKPLLFSELSINGSHHLDAAHCVR
ncbi:hypothetical protein ACO0LC_28435 [Undibacterium sp. JH2W]|uniref:hypothetical protein n=1 Tax=Undibacterium sp. JH2W TaxID=3413037 RepID=UPI003BEFB264